MSDAASLLLAGALGYLLGTVPFGWLLVRWRTGADLATTGSGNVGAMNSLRVTRSVGTGVATLLLDFAKGAAAVLLVPRVVAGPHADLAAMVGAVAGHSVNPWLSIARRRVTGGKGFAAAAGGAAIAVPWILAAWIAVLVVVYAALRLLRGVRDEAPASLAASAALPPIAHAVYGLAAAVAFALLLLLVLPRLLPESRRVLAAASAALPRR